MNPLLKIFQKVYIIIDLRMSQNLALSGLMYITAIGNPSPNQAMEPTRGAVTPRAYARAAPAPRVAHL